MAHAAAQRRVDDDAVADLDATDRLPHRRHLTGGIAAGDVGEVELHPGEAPARPDVVVIEADRVDLQQDVVRAEAGFLDILVLQNLGSPVLMKDYRLHAIPPQIAPSFAAAPRMPRNRRDHRQNAVTDHDAASSRRSRGHQHPRRWDRKVSRPAMPLST
jgi:hypothetical protein